MDADIWLKFVPPVFPFCLFVEEITAVCRLLQRQWFARLLAALVAGASVCLAKFHIKLFVTLSYCSYTQWRWLIYPNYISKFNSRVEVSTALGWEEENELKSEKGVSEWVNEHRHWTMATMVIFVAFFDWSSTGGPLAQPLQRCFVCSSANVSFDCRPCCSPSKSNHSLI